MFFGQEKYLLAKDFAYMELKDRIIKGKLLPGQVLIEEKLAENLEVSRTPLREALIRLEVDELVVRKRNGRLRVAPVSIEEVKELFGVRNVLECMIIEQATKKATQADVLKLKQIIEMAGLAVANNNVDDIIRYGNQFHHCLYEISGHKTAVKMLTQLNDHITRYRRLIPGEFFNQNATVNDHEQLLKRMIDKEPKAAKQAMQAHIDQSLTAIVDVLTSMDEFNGK